MGEAKRENGESSEDVDVDVGASHSRASTAQGVAETIRASSGSGAHIAAGTLLEGTYRVEELLGKGAMGAVYLVEHVALGKKFAVKVVADSGGLDAAGIARLRNEARMASSIDHENIVRVTHLGMTPDGNVFVVMELLRGEDLRARAVRHRKIAAEEGGPPWLSDLEVRGLVSPLLSALDAAHAAGIVHRDLKPENVFLHERQGRLVPKIVDFGIGKLRSPDESLRLTATGQIVGTPLYMAPEQTRSTHLVDHRADIYAMGVMLFELLTGRLPFEATGIYEIVIKHVTEAPPDPRTLRPDLPEAVAAVVLRCLAKSPDARFQTAAELLAAWEDAWGDDIGVPSLPVTGGGVSSSGERASPARHSGRDSGRRDSGGRDSGGRQSSERDAASSLAVTMPAAPAKALGRPLEAPSASPITAPATQPSEPSRPRTMIAVGAVILVAAVIVMWALGARPSGPAVTAAPVAAPPIIAPIPEPIPEPVAPIVAPEPPPAATSRRVESDPPGAEVVRDGVVIGTTPLDVELSGDAPLRLELRRRGYQSVELEIGPSDPDPVRASLPRRERRDFPSLAPL